jgi:two-component system response regulator AtoC
MPKPRILIVEDDADWQEIYRRCLQGADYNITPVRKLDTAMALLEEQPFDVVITDLKMLADKEGFSGFGVLEHAKAIHPNVQVIVITGYGSADHALRAMGSGAYDYITKGRDLRQKLSLTVQGALEIRSLKQELLEGEPEDDVELEYDRIVGNSARMQVLFEQIASAAESDVNVLISGEESTGKRLIAQTIHRRSRRKSAPFLVVDCGRLSDSVLESELFGHEAGVGRSSCIASAIWISSCKAG